MTSTWGIPGPAFVAGYSVVIALVTTLAVLHRRRLFRGAPTDVGRLGPQELADLAGSRERAVHACVGGLSMAGLLVSGHDGTLAVTGPLPAGATDLDRAVHDAAGAGLAVTAVTRDEKVAEALHQMRDRLIKRGFAIGPKALGVARRWVWALGVLAGLGVARIVAGVMAGEGAGVLLVPVAFAVLAIGGFSFRRVWASRRTKSGIKRLRSLNSHLDPALSPTYSSSGLALGIALFGPPKSSPGKEDRHG